MTLIVDNLTFRLKEKILLAAVSLKFKPGEVTAILGPNGSGKSTLFKTMAGIWPAVAGRVCWNGVDILKLPRKEISRTLSLVPQNPPLYFDYTVEEMVRMGGYSLSEKNQELTCLENVLKMTDLCQLRNRQLTQLSGGEKQRAYIARSLVTKSTILLLDEPTSHLDLRHQLEIWQLLRRLADEGKTVVVAVHELSAVQHYCDQAVVIDQGKVAVTGPSDLVAAPDLLKNIFGVQACQITGHYTLI
ncbi:MAG: ABC transporter ATP-binding protein [Candidatus Protochlamydia sp.]|nr:ABC transporter ATP-binding protein [Candidatus Protochlamydia sp.]